MMPELQEMRPPVILAGRGGSGTRLLSQLVHSGGVFLGSTLNVSFDSVEWVGDLYPLALEALTAGVPSDSSRDRAWRRRLQLRAAAILAKGNRSPTDSWGWKLPETILALPQVLRAFPGAQVVHLVRHPVSSALRRTHRTSRLNDPIGRYALPAAYRACDLDPGSIPQDEPWFHNIVSWTHQVRQAADAMEGLAGAGRGLVLRYEDFFMAPERVQGQLGALLGRDFPGGLLELDPSRCGVESAEANVLERIWTLCGDTAARVGYCPGSGSALPP